MLEGHILLLNEILSQNIYLSCSLSLLYYLQLVFYNFNRLEENDPSNNKLLSLILVRNILFILFNLIIYVKDNDSPSYYFFICETLE